MSRKILVVVLAALALAGCVTQTHKQITELRRDPGTPPRILLMPLNVELSELSAGGVPDPKADWTEAANTHMMTALQAEQAARSIHMITYDEEKAPAETRDDLNQLVKLNGVVGQSIQVHQYVENMTLPTKQGKFDWSLGPGTKTLKEIYGADYALFFFVRDSYSSGGRVALIFIGAVLGVHIPGGAQIGFASLVDLETGNVVWYNRLARPSGDLRTEPAARETVQMLMAGLPQ